MAYYSPYSTTASTGWQAYIPPHTEPKCKQGDMIRLTDKGVHGNENYIGAVLEVLEFTGTYKIRAREVEGPSPGYIHTEVNIGEGYWGYEVICGDWDK
jgi:hypothetical protein